MARYMECDLSLRSLIKGKKLLELGGGCGLTSMVASVLGADVYCTEQESSMQYLRSNVDLNPDISIQIGNLGWAEHMTAIGAKFDIIVGCDITYDPKQFNAIIQVIRSYLCLEGIAFICHDNDSCPMSKFAFKELLSSCERAGGLYLTEVDYKGSILPEFYSNDVKLWTLRFVS